MTSTYIGILLAAGKGNRFGSQKQNLFLANKPLWLHSLDKFSQAGFFSHLILVVPPGQQSDYQALLEKYPLLNVQLIEGGLERHQSVQNALHSITEELVAQSKIFIHDTARPLFRLETLFLLKDALLNYPAATLGYPVTDALKTADAKGIIQGEVERAHTWAVTTPQAFHAQTLIDLFSANQTFGYDETFLFTQQGLPVKIIATDRYNVKITFPEDLEAAKKLF